MPAPGAGLPAISTLDCCAGYERFLRRRDGGTNRAAGPSADLHLERRGLAFGGGGERRPGGPLRRAAELGFVAALAVADIVPAGRPLRVKWPNDVLVDGGKVAGILLESAIGQTGQVQHVVAGIGVNVGFAPQLPEMRYPGAALGGSVEAALEKLTAALASRLAEWRREGFETVRAAWLAKAGPLGAEVDVKLGEGLVRGRFAGLDREGALLLDTATGPRKIVSGELLGRAA